MGTSPATRFPKPRSFDGWSLDIAVQLDAAATGFLRFLFCASTLRRQAILVALAELVLDGPESLATRLRPLTPPDCPPDLDPYEQIACALMTSTRAREIIRAAYGQVPDGLIGVLHRLGDAPLPEPESYRTLYETFTRPEHRFRARALMQWTGKISAAHIKVVHRLHPLLVHQNILKHVYSTSKADGTNAALALVRATVSAATDDAIRQSVENLGEKSDLEKFFNRWLARMDCPPVKPPIPPDDPDFLVVTTGDALHTLGRRYRNCASQKIPLVAAGAHAYIEWRHAPGAIAECRRTTDGKFLLVDVHAFKNRRPDATLAATIRRKLEERGIPALSPGEGCPRVREVLRLLGVWEFGGDLGFDHDDEDGLAGLGEELGEAADVA